MLKMLNNGTVFLTFIWIAMYFVSLSHVGTKFISTFKDNVKPVDGSMIPADKNDSKN